MIPDCRIWSFWKWQFSQFSPFLLINVSFLGINNLQSIDSGQLKFCKIVECWPNSKDYWLQEFPIFIFRVILLSKCYSWLSICTFETLWKFNENLWNKYIWVVTAFKSIVSIKFHKLSNKDEVPVTNTQGCQGKWIFKRVKVLWSGPI